MKPILAEAKRFGLPMVIDHGHDFAELAYYVVTRRRELGFLTDPEAARKYLGTDSMDLDMIALKRYVDWNIVPFEEFRQREVDFLPLTHFNAEARWPTRFVDDRYILSVVDRIAFHTVYRVQSPGPATR